MNTFDVQRLRWHFDFARTGRVVTNNAASTQPPRELVELYRSLIPWYENVHRGQSAASRYTTELFELAYDTIAGWLNAPGRGSIVTCRNTTEAINTVMYSLLTEFRDGDNVVTTALEHNSNFVPWYAMCREILPRFGRHVEYRVARFDPVTGQLDLEHLASLVDARTKLVACTGASNFLGTRPDLAAVRRITLASGYRQPDGDHRSLLLVDGAQLVPTAAIDVRALGVDYLAFSFHKLMAPFGVGVLYGREELLNTTRPFLYGGDMVAEQGVTAEHVRYNRLPWKYAAGTPNILGVIVSAQALRLLVDLVAPEPAGYFGTGRPLGRATIERAMDRVAAHTRALTGRALDAVREIDGLKVFGPESAADRAPLISFGLSGWSPMRLAEELDRRGVESRAGCHCATLAHRALGLDPPASCRLSFAVYNTAGDVDRATGALREIAARRLSPAAG
ncbi:aminotransferase class V-fold PLP-dependent enzyme [Actinoplanes sp. L3-i22]|uniref:aminotransferase class V-fold PLP-dependent enzyme n=1 Tax=Actinoplanes sp. L3-i22 TaxID=2836373 RepID=UPI001C788915|nr:aminotransferase class V-fold PLP-dependent enzyme [Actinoplanes sp. L3-i22]BCY11990.1 cysteine desulfurase [Actinoplanes sp. L3-i22]